MAGPVRGLLAVVMAVLALGTGVTHLAQELAWSFRTYTIVLALVGGAGAWAVARAELRGALAPLRAHRAQVAVLALLSTGAAAVTLLSHRPRWDDFSYIPNVLHYVAHPGTAMGHAVHFVDGGGRVIESFAVGTSLPFEYVQGAVAYALGLHTLSIYHVAAPALFAALLPCVWFYALTRFELSGRAALAGAAAICLALLLMGESHRGFGNYAFTRIWHGKVVVMALGLPLVVGLTIDWFRAPDTRAWLRLFATATALAGASTSSVFLLAFLAPPLALAAGVALPLDLRTWLGRTAAYAASFAYVGAFGVALLAIASGGLGADDPVNEGFATGFAGQLQYVFPSRMPTTRIFAIASAIGALLLLRGWPRRFLAVWLLAVVAAYVNPFVAPFLMEHVAPNGVYWRLFYLLPFPLALGLAAGRAAEWAGVGATRRGGLLAAACIAALICAHLPTHSTSIFRRNTSLGVGYQIERADRRLAERVIDATPPGAMLAPWYLGAVVTILAADRPQVTTRDAALGLWFTSRGRAEEAALRERAGVHLDGESAGGRDAVLELVRRHRHIRSVVARYGVAGRLDGALREAGFTERVPLGEVEVYVRADADADSTGAARRR